MKVLKFGGTSLGTPQRIKEVAKLIDIPGQRMVVLSAMAGTTDNLLKLTNALIIEDNKISSIKLINELKTQYLAVVNELYSTSKYKTIGVEFIEEHFKFLMSFTQDTFTPNEEKSIVAEGEMLSTALFHYYLEEQNKTSVLLSALNFMRIDENGEPDTLYIEKNLKAELRNYPGSSLFITQGYICRNAFGQTDNLKRGGSDYSASLIGAAIHAEEIQIWTDIDGMHNNDPRFVPDTYPIAKLSFDEAAELAYFGAKILHPSCILPAKKENIPVRLLNTMHPEAKGTLITKQTVGRTIKAVAAKDGITAIKIQSYRMLMAYGFLRNVFEVFERHKIPIDLITTSEVAVSLTIEDTNQLDDIVNELSTYGTTVVEKEQTIICIVGDFLADKHGYALKIFDALKTIPIRMISYGGSSNNISLLIETCYKKKALLALNHKVFQE